MDVEDREACYRSVKSRDRRFDGVFYTGVHTTGIYCRPSCPARTPHLQHVGFFRTAAAAQAAGFRACKRCLPDATPGSPDWDMAADVAGRAMRLIADGVVEREGVLGLAARLGYSSRHLTRLLTRELGAGPLALARARRAQTARTLVETSALTFTDIAFASGFASVRQFNDTMREVYARTPSELRGAGHRRASHGIELRLAVRSPFAGEHLLDFLRTRAVPGVEAVGPDWYARSLRLPHGPAVVRLELGRRPAPVGIEYVGCRLHLSDVRDLGAAVERSRRLLDADCDPVAVDDELADDPQLAALVRARPGLRVPGHVDGGELAVRAVLGQQVGVRSAATTASILTQRYGEALANPVGEVTHLFPDPARLADLDAADFPMPRRRGEALVGLCRAVADEHVVLDRSADRGEVRARMLALPGVGSWTAGYIAMRALGDPDVFLATDHGVRLALGLSATEAEALAARWRPWRSYALLHLWTSLAKEH